MRAVLLASVLLLLMSGCSDNKPGEVPGDVNSEQHLKTDCGNPQWKQQNLGLWYSLCRQPLRF